MSAETTVPPLGAAPLPEALEQLVARRAAEVDGCEADPRATLVALAAEGLLTHGSPSTPATARAGTFADQAAVVAALAEHCLTTAFCAWGHRIALEYLSGPGGGASDAELADLAAARTIGASAMASGFKAHLGLAPPPVRARRAAVGRAAGGAEPAGADSGAVRSRATTSDRLVLDGFIPWASNLHADAVVVLAAEVDGIGLRALAVPLATPGVTVKPARGLLALEASASGQLAIEGAEIDARAMVDEPFAAFADRVRPPFLTLQSAFCAGLARAALTAAAPHVVDGLGAQFAADHAVALATLADVERRIAWQADGAGRAEPIRRHVQLRLDAALLAREAVRIEAAVTGGRGYVSASATARRLREAAFLPVQSPTEGQLRWELQRSA